MALRRIVIAVTALAVAAVCVRLGLWQLGRLHEKQRLHGTQRVALAAPPLAFSGALPDSAPAGRRVQLLGAWEPSAHVLLSGRTHASTAGVSLVSLLRLPSGEGVLVERGWLEAADGRRAHAERLVPGAALVTGVAAPLPRSARPLAWAALPSDSPGVALWSARVLEADSVSARFEAPLAKWWLRALPDSQAAGPGEPLPEPWLQPADETMHLSYALQWFALALGAMIGGLLLARRR